MARFGVTNGRKIYILSWKTLKVKARHYVETLLDIIVPVVLFALLGFLRYSGGEGLTPSWQNATIYNKAVIFNRYCHIRENNNTLLYTPLTKAANDTMMKVEQFITFINSACPTMPDMNVTLGKLLLKKIL
jgi:hypothetical protein